LWAISKKKPFVLGGVALDGFGGHVHFFAVFLGDPFKKFVWTMTGTGLSVIRCRLFAVTGFFFSLNFVCCCYRRARVAELVDALDLGSSRVTCESSSLSSRTILSIMRFFMSVVLERGEGIECTLRVTLSSDALGQKTNKRIQEIASSANLKGFRRGKVPPAHIKTMYGDSIRAEAVENLAKETLNDALAEHKLTPLEVPKLDLSDLNEDPVTYVATFEHQPDIKIADLSKLSVKEETAKLSQQELDEALVKIQEHFATYESITERASELGDRLTVDYLSMGGDAPAADKAPIMQDQVLNLGKHQLPKAFDDYLVGKFAGDSVTVVLPPDVVSKKEGKKSIECVVQIKKVESATLPQLDEAFAKKLGIEGHDKKAFEQEAMKPLMREMNELQQRLLKKRIYEALLKANKVPVSKSLFAQNIKDLSKNTPQEEQQRLAALTPKDKAPEAKRAVKLAQTHLLLMQLKDDLGVTLDEKMLLNYIQELAGQYADSDQFITWFTKQEEQMNAARAHVFERQLVEAILQKAKVKQKQTFKSMQALKACVEKEEA
jgi:trigger factor